MRASLLILSTVVTVLSLSALGVFQRQSRRELEELRATVLNLSVAADANDRRALAGSMELLARAAAQRDASQVPAAQAPVAQAPAQVPADQLASGSAKQPKEDPSLPRQTPAEAIRESQEHVLVAYAHESTDPAWSREASRLLDTTVRKHLPEGSRLRSLECRSTMCQVEVTHTSLEAQSAFLMEGFTGWPGSIFVAGENKHSGELTMTLMAARKGTDLPIL